MELAVSSGGSGANVGYFDAFPGVHFFELVGSMKHFRVNVKCVKVGQDTLLDGE